MRSARWSSLHRQTVIDDSRSQITGVSVFNDQGITEELRIVLDVFRHPPMRCRSVHPKQKD
jgi:hypothetical protein